jgi:hypothetical protein
MVLSCRTFLIARKDTIWRLSSTAFDRMLRDPASRCLPVSAGQRARMASVVVELVTRTPVRVIRTTFSSHAFDAEGRIDPSRFDKQQFALSVPMALLGGYISLRYRLFRFMSCWALC